ncbi:helix-turn-helix domain-containing protein [Pusillimonas sp. SM2304]|uniref:IclR family transcriptional regulator n=1 Tax=Pusillimonas sp. SM2304 TaxID=3073241 RepID=UPI0028741918|nr:helix-turn-helix domain-containing protein [Pusillimonas sp. SM2304]MDS1142463.1 helix-turn-helix domain-containing protein [Pusillimonas sp. SM2304]
MARYPSRTPENSSADKGGVIAVDRALSLLCAFQLGDTDLSLNELVERTELVKSTTLRMLTSLIHFGLIQKTSDGRYRLGAEVARLHNIYMTSFSLENVVMPHLRAMVEETQESASFHVRQGDHRLVLYRVNSPQLVADQGRQGDLLPLQSGAGGRVLTAYESGRGAIYDAIQRDKVIALNGDRVPDLSGISSPVFGPGAKLVGALTLTVPTTRFHDKLTDIVRKHAHDLTQDMGGTFPA